MPNIKAPALIILLLLLVSVLPGIAHGAPKADLWPHWQANDPDSRVTIDHSAWDQILKRYVNSEHPSGINRFAYDSVTPEDRRALQDYLVKMQQITVSGLNRNEQKAYWINAYNSLTVNIILEHYPVRSIRDIDISPGFFSSGPWDAKLLTIEGEKLSLNDIEHRILRPIWQDNRVHYAVNCASLGCPNLQPEAYTPDNLEMLLDKSAREYINHPRGVSISGNTIQVSSIYIWFKEDFGGSDEGIINHLKKYLAPKKQAQLEGKPKKLKHQYDWDLNI